MLLGKDTNIKDQEGFDGMIHSKRGSPRQGCLPSKHSDVLQREPDDNRVKPVYLPEGRLPKGCSKERFANISLSTGREEVCTRLSLSRFGLSGTEHSDMLEGIKVDRRESKETANYSIIDLFLEGEAKTYEPCQGTESQTVQSCLKALFLALEKMTQGFRAEEAQTGEVEKEAEEEKRRQRIKEEYIADAHDGSCHDDGALNIAPVTKKQQQEGKVSFLYCEDSIVQKYQDSSSLVWIYIYSPLSGGLRFEKDHGDSVRNCNGTIHIKDKQSRSKVQLGCLGVLQQAYQIGKKNQNVNFHCENDEPLNCEEMPAENCNQMLNSAVDHKTEGPAVDRFEEAYARVRQSFADIRRNVEQWRDAVLHSTMTLFTKGAINSSVRQLMNRNVATFGKGGNGELVEAFQSGQHLIIKKTLLRESEWSIVTEMRHRNVMPWLALICGGRSDTRPGQVVSYQVMPKMTEDLSASIRKMGGSIHHYILQLQESEEPNAVLSARADLVRLRGAEILRRVLLGLDYMHRQSVVHRDIKASNILLKKPVDCPHETVHTCTCPMGWEVKVADFDSVIHLGVARDRARRRKQLKVGNTGTPGYRAPEVFYESSTSDVNDPDYYSPASDIWSFGGVCLHLAMGFCCPRMQYQVSLMTLAHHRMVNIPAAEAQEKVDRTTGIYHIRQGFTGEKWLDMVNFTARPLEVDRSRRPTAAMLLEDPFLQRAKHGRENDLTDDNTNGNFPGYSLTGECQEAESSNSGGSKRKSSKSPEGTVAQQ